MSTPLSIPASPKYTAVAGLGLKVLVGWHHSVEEALRQVEASQARHEPPVTCEDGLHETRCSISFQIKTCVNRQYGEPTAKHLLKKHGCKAFLLSLFFLSIYLSLPLLILSLSLSFPCRRPYRHTRACTDHNLVKNLHVTQGYPRKANWLKLRAP